MPSPVLESKSDSVHALHSPHSARRPALQALTGVRFFAAFYVVLFHTLAFLKLRFQLNAGVEHFLSNGNLAVAFFYLLSGFILAYTYEGKIENLRDYLRYLRARFARIYPVYLVALLLALPFQLKTTLVPRLAVLFMVQAWNPAYPGLAGVWNYPAWSLSVEAFFYITFPIFLIAMSRCSVRILRVMMSVFLFVSVVLRTPTMVLGVWNGTFYGLRIPLPVLRLPEFLAGVALGLLFLRSGQRPRHSYLFYLAAASAVVVLSLPIGSWVSIVMIPTAFMLYELAFSDGVPAKLFSSGPLVLLGGASYAIYLLQYPVRAWTKLLFSYAEPSFSLLGSVVSPILLIAFSIAVFRYWEEPVRKLLHPASVLANAKK
jgi:peptidoglycan/LPS O-acetylase OafA/YrhL